MQLSGDRRGQVWHAGVGTGGLRRRFDKSRSYPMQLSGDRRGQMWHADVGTGGLRRRFDKSCSYPCNCPVIDAGRCGTPVSAQVACGAVSTNRAATLRNCPVIDAGGFGGGQMAGSRAGHDGD
jgi:hypothetical protein